MNPTTRHLTAVPARPAHDVEAFVLDVHRTHISWCYWPAQARQARRVEYSEAQAGTYPVRVETSPTGDLLAVVDLDTFVMRRVTWRWIFPRIERPCVRAVSDVAWLTDEVADGAPAMTDDDGTPLATWRRLDTEETPKHCGASNGPHHCLEPAEHTGDHVCAGCADVWNRGPWDEDPDDLDPWDGTTCLDDPAAELDDDEENR